MPTVDDVADEIVDEIEDETIVLSVKEAANEIVSEIEIAGLNETIAVVLHHAAIVPVRGTPVSGVCHIVDRLLQAPVENLLLNAPRDELPQEESSASGALPRRV